MPHIRDKWGLPIGDWNSNVILDQFPNIESKKILGIGRDLTLSADRTIWEYAETANILYPTSSSIGSAAIACGSASDNAGGPGARQVEIRGLDINFNPLTEVVSLNGQTPVPLTEEFYRFHQMEVVVAGSENLNMSNVYIGGGAFADGIPSSRQLQIESGSNLSAAAVYTIPASYTGVLYTKNLSTINGDINFRLYTRNNNSGDIFRRDFLIYSETKNVTADTFLKIAEKTDIEMRVFSTGGDNCSIYMDLFLINNNFFNNNNR